MTYLVIGVVLGSTYALLAVGIVFMYQTTRVLNFAFGAFGMVAAYAFDDLQAHMDPFLAYGALLLIAVVVGVLFGILTLPVQDAPELVKLVASLALLSALVGAVVVGFGNNFRTTPVLTRSVAFHVAGVEVSWQRLAATVVSLVLCGVIIAFLRWTRIGIALRAVAFNREISKLVGLPVNSLWMGAWAMSTFIATAVAILVLPEVGLSTDSLTFFILTPMAAAMAAQFRSIGIALIAALGLGIAQGLFTWSRDLTQYGDVLPLLLVIGAFAFAQNTGIYERV